jgi:VWFA-related protein
MAAVPVFALSTVRGYGATRQPSADQSIPAGIAPAGKGQKHEVLLPVIVLDKHGALVTNLTANDFTLTDDGRPQTITSLTAQSNLPLRLGLLVDTNRRVYSAMDSERAAAGKFIDLMLPADAKPGARGNEAFLIHFDREVELLEDFTSARDKLHHELDGMTPTVQENSSQGPETSGQDNGGNGADSRRQFESRNDTQLYDAIYLASDELMKPKDGRKALIVFSDGADHGSKETMNDAVDAADRANVQVFTIYFKGEENRTTNGPPGSGHHGGIGGVGFPGGGWPGNQGGKPGAPPRSEAGVDGRKIMQQIAWRTGGQYFEAKKKADLDHIYSEIATLLQQQYLLTYTPDKSDFDGSFHKIALKANRKDVTVYTREGYYMPSQ